MINKFRVWNGQEMIYDVCVYKNTAYYCKYDDNEGLSDVIMCPEYTEIMQYIGMDDRLGNEIWEGDIIQVTYKADNGDLRVEKGVIKYNHHHTVFVYHTEEGDMEIPHYSKVLVVGHKHSEKKYDRNRGM